MCQKDLFFISLLNNKLVDKLFLKIKQNLYKIFLNLILIKVLKTKLWMKLDYKKIITLSNIISIAMF